MSNKQHMAAVAEAAFEVAREKGLHKVTRDAVAEKSGLSAGTVSGCYHGEGLRVIALRVAINKRHLPLLEYLVAGEYRNRLKLPDDLKIQVLKRLTK